MVLLGRLVGFRGFNIWLCGVVVFVLVGFCDIVDKIISKMGEGLCFVFVFYLMCYVGSVYWVVDDLDFVWFGIED